MRVIQRLDGSRRRRPSMPRDKKPDERGVSRERKTRRSTAAAPVGDSARGPKRRRRKKAAPPEPDEDDAQSRPAASRVRRDAGEETEGGPPSESRRRKAPDARFVCEVCSKTFKNRESFRRHVRRHGDPDALLKCPHCDFRTLQKSTWVQHLAVLHKVDPQGNRLTEDLKCSQCDFVCVTKYQLRSHVVRKHTVDKPFKCAECDYATVMRSDIEKHVSIRHRHERLYMCETCGFRSQTQGGYNRHVRSHSGVKPFKCELCGQAYADSPKLKIHLQKHASDEKPFVCHLCGHACRRMDNLQMHLKRIHKAAAVDARRPPTSDLASRSTDVVDHRPSSLTTTVP